MDKKELLSTSLARIMLEVIKDIHTICDLHPAAPSVAKLDGSPVTALDLALSDLLERISLKFFNHVTVYSEEKYSAWEFPLMAIDPLDGTRDYIRARPEWAVSIGYFDNENFQGQGWVYNPMTRELYDSEQPSIEFVDKKVFYGEVSHSEWDRGWYSDIKSEKYKLTPKGSIAYKLGRLSGGKIDFVVSLAPKNIWDIAGGTLLCHQNGMKFYSQGKEVTRVQKQYQPPLIWCFEESFSELSSLFPPMDTDL